MRALRIMFGALLAVLCFSAAVRADEPTEKIVDVPGNIEQLLANGDFGKLEDLAAQYRSTQVRTWDGYWTLGSFYNSVSAFAGAGCGCRADVTNVTFDVRRKQLESWFTSRPKSLTARIALADMWEEYAWTRRGGDVAGKVSDAQWEAYYANLARADDLLRDLDPTADPEVFRIEMLTAARFEDPRARLDDLYPRAVKAFPTYVPFYTQRFYDLQERWYGQPGESTAFVASLLNSPGGDEGKIIYVAVASTALDFHLSPSELISFSGVDYGRLIEAYGALQRVIGLSYYNWNVLMYYSVSSLDRNGIQFAAQKIGGHWEHRVWGTKDNFDTWVNWSARPL
jgi:hypothetical protein